MKVTHRTNDADLQLSDYLAAVLHIQLASLSDRERIAIFLRYWQVYSIAEIAGFLKIEWDQANHLLEKAHATLAENEHLQLGRNLLHFYELGKLTEE